MGVVINIFVLFFKKGERGRGRRTRKRRGGKKQRIGIGEEKRRGEEDRRGDNRWKNTAGFYLQRDILRESN